MLRMQSTDPRRMSSVRVLLELKDHANILPKKVKTEDDSQDDDQPHYLKIECQQVVDEFKKLKFAFVHLQAHIKLLDYLENVPKDQWPSVASCDEESKKIRRQLKEAKAKTEDLEEHIQDLMKSVKNCQETLNAKLVSFEKMIKETEDRAVEVEQLVRTRSGALAELEGSGVTLENFQAEYAKQDEGLKAAKDFLAHCQPVVRHMKEGTENLHKEKESLMEDTKAVMETVSEYRAEKESREQQLVDKMKWCESASKMLKQLTGVSERSLDENCWTLELSTDDSYLGNKESMTALLALHFKEAKNPWSSRQLEAAKIDIDTLDISDLVEEAVRRNDAVFLVSSVMKRLKTHAPLYMEVELLRHQYAIDWVSEEGILRVIFGDSAQIVCTLSLTTGPQGRTMVQLKSLEGVKQHPPIQELKPSCEEPKISDWLEFLKDATQDM
ncbi:uncharacterized protein LOC110973478 [Acanthaster planci]|uniref:Uncharacterized protein LOC110973478 n=1 Tax=Acanthaster planci TaxID=133434 RepID=A0A8B7XJA3_ACAPL|nr:uncharacterized protein LOC110973478 [Acanthaster planci]